MKIDKINLQNVRKSNVQLGFKANVQNLNQANVNEFSKDTSMGITALGKAQVSKPASVNSVISFTGGNPKQVAHLISEGALTKGGGVATVINDWIKQWGNYLPEDGVATQHNFFIPYYNGDVITQDGVTEVFTATEGGKPFFVAGAEDISQVTKFNGSKTELSEMLKGTIKDVDVNGNVQDVPYRIFEATANVSENFLPKGNSARVFVVDVPKTSAMVKQYANRTGGEYAYVGGQLYENYAQFAKATVDAMGHKESLASVDGVEFDPKNFVIHDWHPSAAAKFIQDEAIKGNPMYQDVNVGYIIHNIGRGGYQGLGSSEYDMFKALATPEQFKKVVESADYKELFSKQGPEAVKAQKEFWKSLMPGMVDELDTINPSMIPINLAKDGFINIAGVSPGYVEEIVSNSEFAEGLTGSLKTLKDEGHLMGVTNGLAKPARDLQISSTAATYYSPQYFETMKDEHKALFKFTDGSPIKPMLTFDPENVDVKEVADVKKANKFNFIERIVKFNDKEIGELPEGMQKVHVVTGVAKPATITTTMNKQTLASIQESNPKMFVSWGRGDFQKGIDELLDGIIKFVKSDADDKKSLFVVCGGLDNGAEGVKIKDILKKITNMSELDGRFAFIDGWGPSDAMASASDFAIFSSRFEPCGLTPQETYARGGLVIGSNTGGMKRTIIDFADGTDSATGLKMTNGFYAINPDDLTKEQLESTAAGKKLVEALDKASTKIKKDFDLANQKRARHGKELKPALTIEEITKEAKKSEGYQKALRLYRDDVMSTDIAEQIKRAVQISDSDIDKMRFNAITRPMDWHNNVDTNDGKSALKQYEDFFFKGFKSTPSAPVSKAVIINDEFISGLKQQGESVVKNTAQTVQNTCSEFIKNEGGNAGATVKNTATNFTGQLKELVKGNKIATALVAGVALLGGAYLVTKNKAKKQQAQAPEPQVEAPKAPEAVPAQAVAEPPKVEVAQAPAQVVPEAPKTANAPQLSPANQKYTMQNFIQQTK